MPDTFVDKEDAPAADEPGRDPQPELAQGDPVQEPPPPTLPDVPVQPAVAANRGRACVVAMAIATLLVGAAIAFVYVFVWRYEPTARKHIPDGSVVAGRLEAADVVLFGPVRRHLWPLVEPGGDEAKPAPDAKPKVSRVARIAELTGIHLGRDVRELAFAVTDPNSWVVLAGGNFERGRFVRGMATLFKEEAVEGWSPAGELLVGPGGMTIAQADDGTIVLGTNADVATAALPATDAWESLEMPAEGAVVFAITERAWKGIASTLPPGTPRADVLAGIRHGGGRLVLGDTPKVELRLQGNNEKDATLLAADIEALLATLRVATLLSPDRWGEKEALGATTVTPEAWSVIVRAPWPMSGLDRACEQLAATIRAGRATAH